MITVIFEGNYLLIITKHLITLIVPFLLFLRQWGTQGQQNERTALAEASGDTMVTKNTTQRVRGKP